MLAARRAGTIAAIAATTTINTTTPASASGSRALT
jgi:hypothetical protein